MKKKFYIVVLITFILILTAPPLLAPIVHNQESPQSSIRKYIYEHGHPYQSFIAVIRNNGEDDQNGMRYDVTWYDFDNETKMTGTIFYVKKMKKNYYKVVSVGTGP